VRADDTSAARRPATRTAASSPARPRSWTTCGCRGCCTRRSCAATTRTPHPRHRRLRGAARPGVVAVYTAEDLGDYWQPGPLLVPPPPIEGIVFNQASQVPLAKDRVRHVGEAIAMVVAESRYLAEDALADVRGGLRAAGGGGRPGGGAGAGRARHPPPARHQPGRARGAAARGLRGREGGRAPGGRAPLPLRPRRRGGDGEPRRGRRLGPARGAADGLGHHPGADPHPQRAGADAGAAGEPRAGGRALRGGRLRAQDHDVLPGGGAGPLGGDAAGTARQVDRGPAGELLRHHPGALAGARRRDGARRRRAHPRHPRPLPARHRRLRPVRAHRPHQQPVHPAGAVPGAGVPQRVPRGVHQPHHGHAGARRGAAARRVRGGAAAGPRRPRAGDGPGGDPPPQLPGGRRLPPHLPDPLPGLRPPLLRQRQLRPRAGGRARHRGGGALPRRAGGGARRGAVPGDGGRQLRGGDGDRAVRGRAGHHRAQRARAGGHRAGDAGAGALHRLRPDRGRGAGRGGGDGARGHRRHEGVRLGDGDLRQPRRGGGGERLPRGRAGRAPQGGGGGGAGAGRRGGRRGGGRRRVRLRGKADPGASRSASSPASPTRCGAR
jgi:hypothetical protein